MCGLILCDDAEEKPTFSPVDSKNGWKNSGLNENDTWNEVASD